MAPKYSLKFCQDVAIYRGGECLSAEYKNTHVSMVWKCKDNHIWNNSLSGVWHLGQWCSKCSGRAKLTIEFCKEWALKNEMICLSNDYKNVNTKMSWKCNICSHIWESIFYNIKNLGSGCPRCAKVTRLPIEHYQKIAESNGGKLLTAVVKNAKSQLQIRCRQGHVCTLAAGKLTAGQWCKYCNKITNSIGQSCKAFAAARKGRCLDFVGTTPEILWQCKFGHQWYARYRDVVHNNRWCPKCDLNKGIENAVTA